MGSSPASSSVRVAPGDFGTVWAGLSSATRSWCVSSGARKLLLVVVLGRAAGAYPSGKSSGFGGCKGHFHQGVAPSISRCLNETTSPRGYELVNAHHGGLVLQL